MTITIYHNPDCGTSRNTLAMIRQSGEEPVVIEYLKNPPSRQRLLALVAESERPLSRSVAAHPASVGFARSEERDPWAFLP